MSLIDIHARLSNTALLFVVLIALWSLWRFFRRQGADPSYWGALLIGEILILAQGALGGYLWLIGLRPDRGGIHILYGVACALVIPTIYTYTRGGTERRVMLVYGVALLFLAGLVIRSIVTGGS